MKEKDIDILTRQEVEDLCRLYLDCRLTLLEEKELEYILGKLDYKSPVIDEAKMSMTAEGLLRPKQQLKRPARFRWRPWMTGVAASIAIMLGIFTIFSIQNRVNELETAGGVANTETTEHVIIAYEGGRQLSPAESEKAVEASMAKAEQLIAMADAKLKEEQTKQNYIIEITSLIK